MFDDLTEAIQFFLGQHDLRLMNPEGLLLLLAIPVFAVLGLWMGQDLRWYRRWLIQLLRAGVVACLAIALAQPVEIAKERAPAVVLIADLSDSLPAGDRGDMQANIRDLWSDRGEATTFLVGFGEAPMLLGRPGNRRVSLPDESPSDVTDIAAALRFAYGLFPPGQDRRAVIFSDGAENRGDLLAEAKRARAFGITVHTVPVVPASESDMRVDQVVAPISARDGESVPVEVEVFASVRRRAAVRLMLGKRLIERRVVQLPRGASRVPFSVQVEGAGWHRLTARAEGRDRYPGNNWAASRIHVTGHPRVLLVQRTLKENPLRTLLAEQELELRVVTPATVPTGFKELAELDLVILDDLDLSRLSGELVRNFRSYVEEYGGGLIVSAGQAASELAGPEDFPVEALLPVHFRQVKKKEKIPAALVFVMDRSSSMARSGKFSILLRAVVDALARIKDTAQVGMVMFDDFPEVVVQLTEARHRDKIQKLLVSQRVGGGTSIYPALHKAHLQLRKSAARLKHVILLSDGQSISLYAQYGHIVDKMARDHITVTCIALGEDADKAELRRITGRTGGRFYFTDRMSNVPKIFSAETENLTEDNVVDQPIHAEPAKIVEVLAGIDFKAGPQLKGYMASEPRPTSEVLLKSSDRGEPLLARWRFGLGRVTVWTTDAQGSWAKDWPDWSGFKQLWPRLVKDNIRSAPPGDIRLQGRVEEDRALLTVRVPAERPGQRSEPPRLVAYDPAGRRAELSVVRRGLGLYRAEALLDRLGPYSFEAERVGRRGALERAYASLSRTYKEEYLTTRANPRLLGEVARATGGKVDPDAQEVFAPGREERERREEKWPPFLFVALGLFLAEVFLRRI